MERLTFRVHLLLLGSKMTPEQKEWQAKQLAQAVLDHMQACEGRLLDRVQIRTRDCNVEASVPTNDANDPTEWAKLRNFVRQRQAKEIA